MALLALWYQPSVTLALFILVVQCARLQQHLRSLGHHGSVTSSLTPPVRALALVPSSMSTSAARTSKQVASSTETASCDPNTLSPLETSTAEEDKSDGNDDFSDAPSCAKQMLTNNTDTEMGGNKECRSPKNDKDVSASPASKKGRDERSYCAYCTRFVKTKNVSKTKTGAPRKTSYFKGCTAKRKSKFCERCLVALCTDTDSHFKKVMTCFDRWHSEVKMPDEDDIIDEGQTDDTPTNQEANSNDNNGEDDSSDEEENTAPVVTDGGVTTSDQVLI